MRIGGSLSSALAAMLVLACGDNRELPPPPPLCTPLPDVAPLSLEAAREAHRRAELRRHLRMQEAVDPGYTLRTLAAAVPQERIDQGQVCFSELHEAGRLLFEHTFSYVDGLAAGDEGDPFRRVQAGRSGGPETVACTSCHWRGGPAGAGSLPDNSFLLGDGDQVSSADPRNPPSLLGAGAVQALAAEMSADLALLRAEAVTRARDSGEVAAVELVSKGVRYGTLRAHPGGALDVAELRGIDADLVVRPFGWKGNAATVGEFVAEAAFVHFGIQSEDVLATGGSAGDPLELGEGPLDDPDGDGVIAELTAGLGTALSAYVAALELPIVRPPEVAVDRDDPAGPTEPYLLAEWARGQALFSDIGCASCHVPSLVLNQSQVQLLSPVTGVALAVDLARDSEAPRLRFDGAVGGYPVYLFSDLKRHDLGDENASQHVHGTVGRRMYLTRRLWGLAQTGPYFYDGQSASLDHAIERHGGEASFARDGFRVLDYADKGALRVYLISLRREPRFRVP